jgi:uncharacterized phiE125 gp8 family phage protein
MSLTLTLPPAVEPVSLAEAKAHLRLETAADDGYIVVLITTARLQIEAALGLALVNQTWSYSLDAWPAIGPLRLPLSPVAQLISVRSYDALDALSDHPLSDFQLDGKARSPRLLHKVPQPATALRAMNALEIVFVAGFGPAATAVPAAIRHALLLLLAHWYEHRDPSEAEVRDAKIPDAVSVLLAPWRQPRLA